ncbi:MAG: triose-phosphate isomerase [archaeon]
MGTALEPLVVLNFKAYTQAIGQNALKLAKIAKGVSEATGVRVIIAPQSADLKAVSKIIETYAQHIDPISPGSGTGAQLTEATKLAGATGSLINHSEKRIELEQIEKSIKKLHELGMKALVCSHNADSSKAYAAFNPDFIAVEPPALIGSGVSVSTANPEIITDTIAKIREVNQETIVLCGAGISNGVDVKKAVELGVSGVLLASAFTKAEDPKAVLEDICGGYK